MRSQESMNTYRCQHTHIYIYTYSIYVYIHIFLRMHMAADDHDGPFSGRGVDESKLAEAEALRWRCNSLANEFINQLYPLVI